MEYPKKQFPISFDAGSNMEAYRQSIIDELKDIPKIPTTNRSFWETYGMSIPKRRVVIEQPKWPTVSWRNANCAPKEKILNPALRRKWYYKLFKGISSIFKLLK